MVLIGDARVADALDEKSRRHRQLRARERRRKFPANQAVRAIRTEQMIAGILAVGSAHDHRGAAARQVDGFLLNQPGARANGGVDERAIEDGAADDDERALWSRAAIDQGDFCVRTRVGGIFNGCWL